MYGEWEEWENGRILMVHRLGETVNCWRQPLVCSVDFIEN